MNNKFVNILLKTVRILLPIVALILGAIHGSYEKVRIISDDQGAAQSFEFVASNYFAFGGEGLMDWVPLICMLLCIAAVVMGIICAVKENENNLIRLAHLLCFAMVADLLIVIFMTATVLGWVIAGVLAADLVIVAVQEMKMEDAKRT